MISPLWTSSDWLVVLTLSQGLHPYESLVCKAMALLLVTALLTTMTLLCASGAPLEVGDRSNPNQPMMLLPELVSSVLMRYFLHPFQPVQFYLAAKSAVHQREQWDAVGLILRHTSGHCTVMFGNLADNLGQQQHLRTHAILLGEDVDAFERLIGNFSTTVNDYSGRYLLVVTARNAQQNIEWSRLFRFLWLRHIVHVNVLLTTANGTVRVYTYEPYSPNHCGRPVAKLVTVFPGGIVQKQHRNLYPRRRLTSLHNCTLQVGSFEAKPYTFLQRKVDGYTELGGFEGDLLRLLAHRLQFRVNVTESPNQMQWGVMGPPGNSTGTMQLVQDELVDLVIACMALDVTRSSYLKPGWAHYTSRILFAVPQGRQYSAFEKLFRPFRLDIWAALGGVLGMVATVVGMLSCGQRARTWRGFVYGPSVHMPLLRALYLLWGGSVVAVPRRNFARSLLVLWLGFTFVLRTLYQGSLYLYLQRSATYPPLATIDEIQQSTLHYHMVNIAMRFFVDRPDIKPRTRFIPAGLDTLGAQVAGMASRYQDRVVVCPEDMVAYNNKLNRLQGAGELIQVARESITLFPITIYYPKKSFLTQLFDREVLHIVQSGLMDYWVRNYGDYDFEANRRAPQSTGEPHKLTLHHLEGAYQLLVGSHLLATMVFLLELVSLRSPMIRRVLEYSLLPRMSGCTPDGGLKQLLVRETVGNHFSEVIVDALNRYYVQNHSSTLLMRLSTVSQRTYDLQSDIMDEVMQRTSHSIAYEYQPATHRYPSRRPRIFNLAFIDGYDAFEQLFRSLDPARNDFSGYYLIVLTTVDTARPETLAHMFNLLWTLNVINVNIVTADLQDYSHWQAVLMYTYYPYTPDGCERNVPHLVHRFRKRLRRLDQWIELFPNKLSNFHRCKITVCTFHLPPYMLLTHRGRQLYYDGFEGDMLRALSVKLNFTLRLIEPEAGELWGRTPAANETETVASGCVRLVVTERVNLTLGRFAIRGDRNLVMKSSRSYYTVRMIFAVPVGREYTSFEKLFRPFARSTWILVTLYLLAALLVIYTIQLSRRPYVRDFVYGRGISTPILNLLSILFGGALQQLPVRNFARTLLFLWMYYCLVVRTCYQGSLFEYLQEHKNVSPPQTVNAMVEENYRFYSLYGSSLYLQQMATILSRITWLEDEDASVERHLARLSILQEPDTALFTDIERVAYYNRFHARDGPVYVANVVLVRLPIGMYYPKKSCLANQFDRELDSLLTSGYVSYRLGRYVDYDAFKPPTAYHHAPTPLTIDHLVGCFETLLGLLLVATGLFLVELLSRRIVSLRALFTILPTV
uniref:Ionotropic glutamate receptor L-glutamate and glycine-binding domain-containing protein n=1 Tax=Anopheles minimus TaxID=112268 RepID=A0A182W4C0_9DIPT